MSKKTIKELAEEIGVSKTAISKKVTETQKKKWFTKIGNQFVISEEGQKVIKSMFISDKKNQSQTDKQTSFRNNENQVYDSYFYQEQLLACVLQDFPTQYCKEKVHTFAPEIFL